MTAYTVRLDDDDRADAPESPWTATLIDENGDVLTDAGVGATPGDAVRDLLATAGREHEDFAAQWESVR